MAVFPYKPTIFEYPHDYGNLHINFADRDQTPCRASSSVFWHWRVFTVLKVRWGMMEPEQNARRLILIRILWYSAEKCKFQMKLFFSCFSHMLFIFSIVSDGTGAFVCWVPSFQRSCQSLGSSWHFAGGTIAEKWSFMADGWIAR